MDAAATTAPGEGPPGAGPAEGRRQLRFGQLWVDSLTFDEALSAIEALVAGGAGGAVYTPNVDHVVRSVTR